MSNQNQNQTLDSIIDDVEVHPFNFEQSVGYMAPHANVSNKAMRASVQSDLISQHQNVKFPSFEKDTIPNLIVRANYICNCNKCSNNPLADLPVYSPWGTYYDYNYLFPKNK
jgi:hypothetical protein